MHRTAASWKLANAESSDISTSAVVETKALLVILIAEHEEDCSLIALSDFSGVILVSYLKKVVLTRTRSNREFPPM